MYVYVCLYTYCVLTNPPIPSSPCDHMAKRQITSLERAPKGPPHVCVCVCVCVCVYVCMCVFHAFTLHTYPQAHARISVRARAMCAGRLAI